MVLAIVIKATQKFHAGTWSLSLHHDFFTSSTTAFLLSEGLWKAGWSRYIKKTLLQQIIAAIPRSGTLHLHPFFLPAVLLSSHVHRATDYVIWDGEASVTDLEDKMGITRVGPTARVPPHNFLAGKTVGEAQKDAFWLLVALNGQLTETLFMIRVSEWQTKCLDFLRDSHRETCALLNQRFKSDHQEIMDELLYLGSAIENLADFSNTHKARIQSQLDAVSVWSKDQYCRCPA
jgi:hypothetical protein